MRAGVLPEQMGRWRLPSVSAQQRTAARPISSSVHWSNLVLGGYAGGNDGRSGPSWRRLVHESRSLFNEVRAVRDHDTEH